MAIGIQHDDIEQIFSYHAPDDGKVVAHEAVRDACKFAAHELCSVMAESPEATIAIRKLQECMMYANAAIAIHGIK